MQNAYAKIAYGNGGEEMVDEVIVGDNITMLNSANKGFWIMLVETLVHMVKETFASSNPIISNSTSTSLNKISHQRPP
jgi:hypothetical protein